MSRKPTAVAREVLYAKVKFENKLFLVEVSEHTGASVVSIIDKLIEDAKLNEAQLVATLLKGGKPNGNKKDNKKKGS